MDSDKSVVVSYIEIEPNGSDLFGSILVNIEPQEARQAGAAWRRVGTMNWLDAWTTDTNVPVGSHSIEFKDVEGFTKPANQTVNVQANQTAIAMGKYEEHASGMDDRQWVIAFYVAYWNRAADPDGLNYWLSQIARGSVDVPAVAENFGLSQEAKDLYFYLRSPDTATNADVEAFVRSVYRSLLNREPDQAGLVYWVDVLNRGVATPGLVIGNMIHAAIAGNSTDWLIIWNKIQVADYFVRKFQNRGRPWQDSDLNLARLALNHISEDPASVDAAKGRVDQMLQ